MSSLRRSSQAMPWLVIAGVLTAALSFRGPIVSLTPVMRQIEDDLGISSAAAGLLTTLPVLMFAAMTPVAALVIRRSGPEIALLATLGGVLLGTFIRALPGFVPMLIGMTVIGAAITIGNVVAPVIVRRDIPPAHVATVTAAYTATMNLGCLVTSLLTAPLATLVGWPIAVLSWAILTLAGLFVWLAHMRRRSAGRLVPKAQGSVSEEERENLAIAEGMTGPIPAVMPDRRVWRMPIVWLLMVAFAFQSAAYYGLTTWLPAIAGDLLQLDATAAGALASLFQGFAIVGAIMVPFLVRWGGTTLVCVIVCIAWIGGAAGLVFAPEYMALWLTAGALAQACAYVVIFSTLVETSRSDQEAASMSAFVQGVGYVISAVGGATLLGALHDATGAWDVPLGYVLLLILIHCGALVAAMVLVRRSRSSQS